VLPAAAALIDRFTAACRADERVVAAILGGSHASGAADDHSDVDLYAVLADPAYDQFVADALAFARRLGDPIFSEPWRSRHGDDLVFLVFADGTEAELGFAPESRYGAVHHGPHRVLVDKKGILNDVAFPPRRPDPAAQLDALRGEVEWFWHNLSHFIKAIAREQPWWAFGALEDLRRTCAQLARLRHGATAEPEGYEKIDAALPPAALAPLRDTVSPPDRAGMLRAARATVGIYQLLARPLAQEHGLRYPAEHERVMLERLARLT
jgi:predicted nucleotidyltransferase